ncbi:MAG: hypothetical protein K2Y18_09635 [Alphaproteobacteria bacterium]|jgi:hypothetical protein|nr:hypothetical protein [Alphaproteobacteria bacterium]
MFANLKSIGLLVIVLQLVAATNACNDTYLDREAGACIAKLGAGIVISQESIMDRLGFLSDPQKVDKKYHQVAIFKELSQRSQENLKGSKFPIFAKYCETLFDNSNDLETQVALHMLLERVYDKYSTELIKFERILARERLAASQQTATSVVQPSAEFLEMFSHADKGINTSIIRSH